MIEIDLDFPPSLNRYWRHVGSRVLISAQGRTYREHVANVVAANVDPKAIPMKGPLIAEVLAYPPDRRRRDVDNMAKCLMDSLEKSGVYRNDYQITDLRIRRLEPVLGGFVTVRLWKK